MKPLYPIPPMLEQINPTRGLLIPCWKTCVSLLDATARVYEIRSLDETNDSV